MSSYSESNTWHPITFTRKGKHTDDIICEFSQILQHHLRCIEWNRLRGVSRELFVSFFVDDHVTQSLVGMIFTQLYDNTCRFGAFGFQNHRSLLRYWEKKTRNQEKKRGLVLMIYERTDVNMASPLTNFSFLLILNKKIPCCHSSVR